MAEIARRVPSGDATSPGVVVELADSTDSAVGGGTAGGGVAGAVAGGVTPAAGNVVPAVSRRTASESPGTAPVIIRWRTTRYPGRIDCQKS